tara:strand:- start:2141 stop:3940 length:1800 start_codon:yes stop_codon:yes gene_type:complete
MDSQNIKYLTRFQKNKLKLSDDCLLSGIKSKNETENETKNKLKINNDSSDIDSHGNIKGLIDYTCKNSPIFLMGFNNHNQNKYKFSFLPSGFNFTKDDEDEDYEEGDDDGDEEDIEEDTENYAKYSSFEENYLNKMDAEDSLKLLDYEEKLRKFKENKIPFRFRLLKSKISKKNKVFILNKIDHLNSLTTRDNEYHKLNTWIEGIQKIPFTEYKKTPVSIYSGHQKISNYLMDVNSQLHNSIYGHEEAKLQILQIISKWIANPKSNTNVIALQGPMGNGKTTLVKQGIAKAINRPFTLIGLGGASDSSFLEGHDYTYEGAKCGRIIEILQSSGCMNPIIFFDELDKLSETKKGQEISNILCHITDSSQNDKFNDKYYSGIDFDISKAFFIFSFNDESKINPILKDRMTVIRMKGFSNKDKINIVKDYLLPDILKDYKINNKEINISDSTITHIINYTQEEGVRKLKELLDAIISKINIIKITNFDVKLEKSTSKKSKKNKKCKKCKKSKNKKCKKCKKLKSKKCKKCKKLKSKKCKKCKKSKDDKNEISKDDEPITKKFSIFNLDQDITFPLTITSSLVDKLISNKKNLLPNHIKHMYL